MQRDDLTIERHKRAFERMRLAVLVAHLIATDAPAQISNDVCWGAAVQQVGAAIDPADIARIIAPVVVDPI